MQKIHDIYLNYCIQLAQRAAWSLKTNPPVGALLVFEDRVIGEGWHSYFGGPHAEVEAISSVRPEDKHLIGKSTLYVTLEPCNHHGKTPACTHLILTHQIMKVVVGCLDPNPLMSGQSVDFLRSKNVNVELSDHPEKFMDLISRFRVNQEKLRPYIVLKWAESINGFIGSHLQRTKISTPSTDILVHQWRAEADLIVIGSRTYDTDKPLLTVRNWPGRNPEKYIFSQRADIPSGYTRLCHPGQELEDSLHLLYRDSNVGSILVEGGAYTLQKFIDLNLWDEARIIKNCNICLSEGVKAPTLSGSRKNYFSISYDELTLIQNNS